MSRFADLNATTTVDLGPCECPGAPHESDWAKVRAEASAEDVQRFVGVEGLGSDGAAEAIADFIPEWNLLGPDGKPWPPSMESVRALKVPTLTILSNAIGTAVAESVAVPNASSAPSPGSSRGSASRARAKTRTHTT